MSKPTTKKAQKFIIIDTSDGVVLTFPTLEEVKKELQHTADCAGRDAEWLTDTFLVYEIKEQIIFNATQKIAIDFGLGES